MADEALRNKIACGVPKYEINNEKVLHALDLAQLSSLLATHPLCLGTIMDDNDTFISGRAETTSGNCQGFYIRS